MINNNRKGLSEEGYAFFRKYKALKTHFNVKDYDYLKHNGAINAPRSEYAGRNDASMFTELARVSTDHFNLLLSNIVNDPKIHISGIEPDMENRIYRRWRRHNDVLLYTFQTDLKKMDDSFSANFTIDNEGNHPYILRLFTSSDITFETLAIMTRMFGLDKLKDSIHDPVFAPRVFDRAVKYAPFLSCHKVAIKDAIKERWPLQTQ